jgi:NADPH:quinone reductase-like Zn-dependent oxidoreductase
VLIRVRAAGAGPDVWHIMAGKPYMARPVLGFRRPKVRIRGWDVSGTVEAVGSAVTEFKPGDEVMGEAQRGSFAELTVAPADKLVRKPERLSFEQAAAVPISGTTAIQALRDKGHVQPGQSVLVIGAGGGVGTFTVQIAKAMGAKVTGVASTSKLDLVRSIGADDVIDYTREDFTDGSRTWDVIVDTAGRRPLRELRRALTPKGTLVIVGGDGGGPVDRRVLQGDAPGTDPVDVRRPEARVDQREDHQGGPPGAVGADRGREGHPGRGPDLRPGRGGRCGSVPRGGPRGRQDRCHDVAAGSISELCSSRPVRTTW